MTTQQILNELEYFKLFAALKNSESANIIDNEQKNKLVVTLAEKLEVSPYIV